MKTSHQFWRVLSESYIVMGNFRSKTSLKRKFGCAINVGQNDDVSTEGRELFEVLVIFFRDSSLALLFLVEGGRAYRSAETFMPKSLPPRIFQARDF